MKTVIDNGDDFILGESARTLKFGKEALNLASQEKVVSIEKKG